MGPTKGHLELLRGPSAPPRSKDLDRTSLHQMDQLCPTHPKESRSWASEWRSKPSPRVRDFNWNARPLTGYRVRLIAALRKRAAASPKLALDRGSRPSMFLSNLRRHRCSGTFVLVNAFRSVHSTASGYTPVGRRIQVQKPRDKQRVIHFAMPSSAYRIRMN